ncbi:hypothetical protein EDEG_00695 [Edhazardia aedis USNM 41457]|uniref:Arf-GAP domain-containing protein n=1 Tax=Edhazardia aedis (strain USNM 41457) TaxID=1003232 RepID=J9DRN8_EDHAE|nr:hypothetical protein EDEG_00695 [Edhazardia aedis USNM 41457]|eukprot:EJW05230.1 hypothetical protein EDEG_00695 [Edhazardia aedis USNM 41457]
MDYRAKVIELSEVGSNTNCVDCNASNPQWASISYGTFICLECAGAHRGYGVQISRVRSVSMDNWTEEMYQIMEKGGNQRFKNFMIDKNLENVDKSVLYRENELKKYRFDLCGEEIQKPKKSNNFKPNNFSISSSITNTDFKSEESIQDKLTTTFWSVSEFVAVNAIKLKDKSMEVGTKFNKSYLTPTTKLIKEKALGIKDKMLKKDESNVKICENNSNHVQKNGKGDLSKWD